jgi:S-DNA-T family DNA segregation ATPase FtsK/SpoIIIE
VLATQRPSVDVITGLIKANIPARIAFNVSSMMDSRVILDSPGAEKLLGRGDMLFIPPNDSKPKRIQGAFISETEVHAVAGYLKDSDVEYDDSIVEKTGSGTVNMFGGVSDDCDPLYSEAKEAILAAGKASASFLQRRLKVGYARAARLLDILEEMGVVGPAEGSKPREVLISQADLEENFSSNLDEEIEDTEENDYPDQEGFGDNDKEENK